MNETEQKPRRSVRKFVADHKVAITVVVTSACWITVNRLALKGHNDFLKEKGLYEEFYTPEEETV
jgi:hypothetical protein